MKQISVSVTDETAETLQQLADHEDRSLSNMTKIVIDRGIDSLKAK